MKNHKNNSKQCFDQHVDCENQSRTNQVANGPSRPKNKTVIYQTSPEGLAFPKIDRVPYYRITGKKAGASINQAQYEQPRSHEKPVIYTILMDGVIVPKSDLAPYYLTSWRSVKPTAQKPE